MGLGKNTDIFSLSLLNTNVFQNPNLVTRKLFRVLLHKIILFLSDQLV